MRFLFATIVVFYGQCLLAQAPSLDQLEQVTNIIQSQTKQQERLLLQAYQGLDAKSPDYDEQVDRIIRQLIQLNSEHAVPLCVQHIDNPNCMGFTFIMGENSNVYMRFLLKSGTHSLYEMLNQAKQTDIAPHKRKTYIWYAGMLLSHLHQAKQEPILKCRDLLALSYDKDLLEPVVAKALITPMCGR